MRSVAMLRVEAGEAEAARIGLGRWCAAWPPRCRPGQGVGEAPARRPDAACRNGALYETGQGGEEPDYCTLKGERTKNTMKPSAATSSATNTMLTQARCPRQAATMHGHDPDGNGEQQTRLRRTRARRRK